MVLFRSPHKSPCTGVFFTSPPLALELNTSICDQRVPNNLRCKRLFPIGDAKKITFRRGVLVFWGGGVP